MAKIGDLMQKIIMSNPKTGMWFLSHMPASFWEKQGRKKVLATFHEAAEKVPAYQKLLKDKGVDPKEVKTFEDFQKKVPIMDKENYISRYSLQDLCLEGRIDKMYTIATSSGSTGISCYWPRLPEQDRMLPKYWELFFRQNWDIDKKATLVVITMALGNWIAGELVSGIIKRIAIEGKYPLSITTPGSDVNQILTIIKGLGFNYDQVIMVAYPSLMKKILEEGKKIGIDWRRLNLKLWLGGEGFTKNWQEYILKEIGGEENLNTLVNVYGTADAGGIAFGSPLVNAITDIALRDEKLFQALFGKIYKFPSLGQNNPLAYFVEEINGRLVITYRGGIPLIRYNTKDEGRIFPYENMMRILKEDNYDLIDFLRKRGYSKEKIWRWPFISISDRAGNVISIVGANVYPENIQAALYTKETEDINSFRLKVDTDEKGNVHFYIFVEIKKGLFLTPEEKMQLEKKYHDIFLAKLLEVNPDYKKSYEEDKSTADPIVKIYQFSQGSFAKKLDTKEIYIDE